MILRNEHLLLLYLKAVNQEKFIIFATLLGYGASAVNPYLAQETIHELIGDDLLDKDYYAAVSDYNSAVLHGIVKIASKMGISTIQSYQGSQIFEAIGISSDVIDEYFTNTVSRIEGITLADIEQNVDRLHTAAFDPLGLGTNPALDSRAVINSEAVKRNIYITLRQFICFSRQQEQEIMSFIKSIQR